MACRHSHNSSSYQYGGEYHLLRQTHHIRFSQTNNFTSRSLNLTDTTGDSKKIIIMFYQNIPPRGEKITFSRKNQALYHQHFLYSLLRGPLCQQMWSEQYNQTAERSTVILHLIWQNTKEPIVANFSAG